MADAADEFVVHWLLVHVVKRNQRKGQGGSVF
jgi:hypothetical protein